MFTWRDCRVHRRMHWKDSIKVKCLTAGLLWLVLALANAGTITVRSSADNIQNDADITLREALMIANGTRAPFDHPNPDIDDEANDVSGDVGAGIADVILVINTIDLIQLQDYLPPLNDSTDSIDAASLTVVSGSGLPADTEKAAFVLDTDGHTISGLTLMNFPKNGIIIKGNDNSLMGTIVDGSGDIGIYITGNNNIISNCISRNNQGFGIWIGDAQNNTITNAFFYSNNATGLIISGTAAQNNKVYQCGIGFNESLQAAGNQGHGVVLSFGANNNRFGDPNDFNRFTFIGNNDLDGIRIQGSGTDNNLLHSIFVGTDQLGADHGNSGAGILIVGAPKNNQFGVMDQAAIGIGFNSGNGITILGDVAEGNKFYRVFIGQHPITGVPMGNGGHGFEIAEATIGTIIGGIVEGTQVEINHTGGANHGLFINGTSATTPISNTIIGVYHIGDARLGAGPPSISGDAIRITGNVDGVVLGETNHPNTTNGAAGYGIRITGPNVRNIQMAEVFVGTTRFATKQNDLGGVWIGNGAHAITLADSNLLFPSYFGGNIGHGITIDASDPANLPHDIIIQNSVIGMRPFDDLAPNTGDGIFIKGPAAGPPPTLQNVIIGRTDQDLGNTISGNTGQGIRLQNVNGVTIAGNRIGTTEFGLDVRANGENGILLDKAGDIVIGSDAASFTGNIISGNAKAGVRLINESGNVTIQSNYIGVSASGNDPLGNGDNGIVVESGTSDNRLVQIGGLNPMFANPAVIDPGKGNLISANTGAGILIKGNPASPDIKNVKIAGNFIGANYLGDAKVGIQTAGVRVEGGKVKSLAIGDKATGLQNLISGHVEDGIRVTGPTEKIIIANNWIGTQIDKTLRLANDRHGLFIDAAAVIILADTNTIHFNKEHGIIVSGAGTQAQFTQNSIHLNEKEGIELADMANADLAPPTLNRLAKPGEELTTLGGKTIPNGIVEIFADPMDTDPGMWGQGQHYVTTIVADAMGQFIIPLTFPDMGTITATVTDAAKNTSEFSSIMSAEIIQTVYHDELPLLVAKKPAFFRLYVDSGRFDANLMADASMTLAGGAAIAPEAPAQHRIMGLNKYRTAGFTLNRKQSEDSFNFKVAEPPLGKQDVEFTLKHGGLDRAKFTLDPNRANFQQTNKLKSAIVPLVFYDGVSQVVQPDFSAIVEMIHYMAAVYPINPRDFIKGTRISGIVIDKAPHENLHANILWQTALNVIAVRNETVLPDGSHPDYASGIINAAIGIKKNTGGALNGYAYSDSKVTVSIDRYPSTGVHTGLTLSHEIGHTAPFNLGDTYAGGGASANNPIKPTESDGTGNWILEKEGAFSPSAAVTLPTFASPGPLWKNPMDNAHDIHDFMSNNERARWVDRETYKVLFKGLGGNDNPAAAGIPVVRQTPIANALIVRGSISSNDTVEFLPLLRKPGPVPPNDAIDPSGIEFTAELQDASGVLLDSKNFIVSFSVEYFSTDSPGHDAQTTVPFYVVLADNPSGKKVIIKKNGIAIAELSQTNNAPTIDLIGPHGPGALPDGLVDISWTAVDDDGDDLFVHVLYSPDGGATRLPVAVDLESLNSIKIPTDQLPTGPAPVFMVTVSDGWDQVGDMSDPPLSVPDREPQVKITHPQPDSKIYADVGLGLFGAALDAEDGILLDSSLVWTLDGIDIAEGMDPTVLIPAGPHTLRLTATDSFGNIVFDEIAINSSSPNSSAGEIADYILGRVTEEPPAADLDENLVIDIRDVMMAINLGR